MNITDFLPSKNALNSTDTPLKGLLNDTLGYFFELFENTTEDINDNLFIQNCTGGYLDLFGKDYNIPRLVDESDEHYRNRLITINSKHFTVNTLYNEFDLQLLTYKDGVVTGNTLLSDNHYVNNEYFVECDDVTWNTINQKYVTSLRRLEL